MIQFNELRITPNDEKIIIDVEVGSGAYYENILIDSIVIDTQDTYVDNGPSVNAVFSHTVDGKSIRLDINTDEYPELKGKLLFVYIITSGEFSYDTPLEFRNNKTVGTIINTYPIYKKAMYYTKELADTNNIPKGFIDQILKIKALELSLKTGNHQETIRYWNKLFKNSLNY
jgi:hypothetical protein